jgi:hypothetical protein
MLVQFKKINRAMLDHLIQEEPQPPCCTQCKDAIQIGDLLGRKMKNGKPEGYFTLCYTCYISEIEHKNMTMK